MFRHLEIIRKKKKEESAAGAEPAAAEQSLPKEPIGPDVHMAAEPGVDLSRRNFLRGLGAAAAVAAMPTVLSSTEAIAGRGDRLDLQRSREAAIDSEMASLRAKLSSPQMREALAGKGRFITTMMQALKRFDYRELVGTKYDCAGELYRHAVQFAYGMNRKRERTAAFIPANAGPSRYMPETAGYGNGFFWGRKDVFMTAQHVVDMANGGPDSKKKCDIACLKLVPEFHARPDQIIYDDTSITDADIHGSFVSIVGIDNDATALRQGPVGCKILSGGAIKLTREWVDTAFPDAEPYFKERLYRSFVIELPRGEAVGQGDARPIAGISGAPVFMVKEEIINDIKNEKKVFAGMFHASFSAPDKDLAFFYGPEMAREQYAHFARNVV